MKPALDAHLMIFILVGVVILALVLRGFRISISRGDDTGDAISKSRSSFQTSFHTSLRRGGQAGSGPQGADFLLSQNRVQTSMSLRRAPGAKSEFPKLQVSSSGGDSKVEGVEVKVVREDGREASADAELPPGAAMLPDPGTEIDLSPAFRRIAGELCDAFGSKVRVKYSVSIHESIHGLTIPVSTPSMKAHLWPDGLEDIWP